MIKLRIRYFIYLLIIVPGILFSSVGVAMSSKRTGNMQSHEPQKSIDPKLFFSNNSFSFYEDQLSMRFDITRRRDIRVVTGILFEIESSDNNMRTVLMDWDSHQE